MSKTESKQTFIDKCFKDKHGKVVLAQWPNAPLVLWGVAEVLSMVWRNGAPHTVSRDVSHGALLVWAVLEVVLGANYFRKLLGFVVLVGVLTAILLDIRM